MKALVLVVLLSLSLAALADVESSHSEAPFITNYPARDNTDVYAFRSTETGRSNWVTLIANFYPLQSAYGGPNYFPLDTKVFYEIYVDQDGDGLEDLTFQLRNFQNQRSTSTVSLRSTKKNGPRSVQHTGAQISVGGKTVPIALKFVGPISSTDQSNLNFLETYTVTLVRGARETGPQKNLTNAINNRAIFTKPFDYAGEKTFGSAASYGKYANRYIYKVNIPGCAGQGKLFVGQRKESFAVNLGPIFDLVNFVPLDGTQIRGGINNSQANNALADKNICTYALEVPISCLTSNGTRGNGVIGVWAATREIDTGIQRSRLANPLVNEVIIGFKDKNTFNTRKPATGIGAAFKVYFTNPTLPIILNILFKDAVNSILGTDFLQINPTNYPRNDLVAIFLTGIPGVNALQNTTTQTEYMRLNTAIPVTPLANVNSLGVIAGDNAGYPNGRRPGDDVVDISLRAVMGVVCTLGLGVCDPEDAVVGGAPFSDGAPQRRTDFTNVFPYLRVPLPGGVTYK